MRIELLQALDEEAAACPEAFGGSVTIAEVTKAEGELNVKLPEDYKQFLLKYGSGAVGEAIILGLKEAAFVATPSIVEKSLQFRKALPEGYERFVVIGIDGGGNPIGFTMPKQEIILFDVDFGGKIRIANTFEEYIEKAFNEEINIHF